MRDLILVLERIADALDRAYPKPKESKNKIKVSMANYKYKDDAQTEELRKLAEKEQDSHPER